MQHSDRMFNRPFTSPIEATYFGVITIALVGYGDNHPVKPISQYFSIYKVFSGFFLIIFTFAVYLSTCREAK